MSGPRLSIIPARAATDPALKPRDLQVLCVLGRHTDDLGWCSKSQVKMAKEMACARSTVFEALERLIAAGYLERYEQEGANGRDCPHLYRVILDPRHLDPAAIDIDDDGPADPADQSAPPAGISAPPAGPGPAPKNDSLRTEERGRAREGNGGEPTGDDPAKFERRVKRLADEHHWPGWASSSTSWAVGEFARLSDSERAEAERRAGDYIAETGKKALSLGVYFKDRKWRDVPERQARPAVLEAPPWGKLWSAARLKRLLAGPETAVGMALTNFEAGEVAAGKADEAQLRREKRARSGWPSVNAMHEHARFGRGVTVPASLEPLGELIVALWPEADAEAIAEWEAEHLRRGWPWLPEFRTDKPLFFPAGGPEHGLRAFEQAIETQNDEGRRHDRGGRQAAE